MLKTPVTFAAEGPQSKMKRWARAQTARGDTADASIADATGTASDEEMTQASATSNVDGAAIAAVAGNEGGPGNAHVSRERALYFATGQRASSTSSAPSARRASAQAGEQKESWPGYFSTARDLDDNRLAAQAARQEELQRKEQEDAKLAESKMVWVPRKKPRTTVLAQDNLVASLQELTLQCLAKHIDLLPTLEYIDATARAQVANAVVKLRRMKSEGTRSQFAAILNTSRSEGMFSQATNNSLA